MLNLLVVLMLPVTTITSIGTSANLVKLIAKSKQSGDQNAKLSLRMLKVASRSNESVNGIIVTFKLTKH